MAHHHDHHHDHTHSSAGKLGVAFFLNLFFTIIEVIGGLWTNSLAILSDAIHDLGDTMALALAWYLERFSRKVADKRFTYGYRRFSVLGAIINSVILVVGTVLIIREAIPRILQPEVSDAVGMMWLAVGGIVFNSIGAFVVRDKGSLNNRVVYLHLLEDVLGWVVVLIGAAVMKETGWIWLDPVLSLGISLYIAYRAFGNLRSGILIVMQGTPDSNQYNSVREKILDIAGVEDIHDLRIWSLDGEKNILSAHIVVGDKQDYEQMAQIKDRVHNSLKQMGMAHSTLEVERCGECDHREALLEENGDDVPI